MSREQEKRLSEFYLACRYENLDKVKELLPQLSLFQLNRFEPNGSTALHAAAFFDHANIVQTLMVHGGVLTILQNNHNLTPAEEANDEIRQLLLSPDVVQLRSQFTDTTVTTTTLFSPVMGINSTTSGSSTAITSEMASERPDWIDAYDNAHRIALENHEYMQKWLTKIPLINILKTIKNDYVDKMNTILTADN
ncbi:unnamed protein product [Didymodactylos carnosus]|uniref:Uncharacterized protein n=1 Tax=Didymodactylos carnosus TaxID=1234261 RepID=A0A815FLJ1_9BILA|nr:unnamed protein product [Didymodactylos carnosus]CAF4177730.1 unnamed protein product [Didymodactylos carnosus]